MRTRPVEAGVEDRIEDMVTIWSRDGRRSRVRSSYHLCRVYKPIICVRVRARVKVRDRVRVQVRIKLRVRRSLRVCQ